jgi:DNA-binding response OmpR family regulator
VARVRALLRRPRLYAASGDLLTKGAVSIRLSERKVTVDGAATSAMAPKEFDLLYQLLLHAPQVVSKEVLSNKVWGIPFDALNPRTLDVHIRRIRQKLGSAAECLKTVPAVGFQWVDKVAAR